jgi:hypothetical protein
MVAPMPFRAGSSAPASKILRLARQIALASRFVRSDTPGMGSPQNSGAPFSSAASRQCSTTVSTASALATSPEAWPPMPSDKTKSSSEGSARKLSSLFLRTRPTSLRAPDSICKGHLPRAAHTRVCDSRGTPPRRAPRVLDCERATIELRSLLQANKVGASAQDALEQVVTWDGILYEVHMRALWSRPLRYNRARWTFDFRG